MKKITVFCALALTLLTAISHADDKVGLFCTVDRAPYPLGLGPETCRLDTKQIEFLQHNSKNETNSSVSYSYDLSVNGKILKLNATATLWWPQSPYGQLVLSYTTADGITIEEYQRGENVHLMTKISNQNSGIYYFECGIRNVPLVPVNDFSISCK